MDVTAGGSRTGSAPRAAAEHDPNEVVKRHSVTTRTTHWLGVLAFFILTMSGLQIFNAAPYLDASDKSDSAKRVLTVGSLQDAQGNATIGSVKLFNWHFTTTHVLGVGDDGSGSGAETARAFPGWLTFPGEQNLADGRRWHFFFAWIFAICGVAYFVGAFPNGNVGKFILRREDLPKLLPMQLYYFGLRKDPPPFGKYNPLQKAAYTVVMFVFAPLIVLTGLALSPGMDAIAQPLTWIFGGRQFARLWHFVIMSAFLGFFGVHLTLVLSTGFWNNMRSMITGRYKLGKHEGEGV